MKDTVERMRNSAGNIRDIKGTVKNSSLCTSGVPEGEKQVKKITQKQHLKTNHF
jgi:hypothetical protein